MSSCCTCTPHVSSAASSRLRRCRIGTPRLLAPLRQSLLTIPETAAASYPRSTIFRPPFPPLPYDVHEAVGMFVDVPVRHCMLLTMAIWHFYQHPASRSITQQHASTTLHQHASNSHPFASPAPIMSYCICVILHFFMHTHTVTVTVPEQNRTDCTE